MNSFALLSDESLWDSFGFFSGVCYFGMLHKGEKFYLCLLLTNVRGPQSYDHLCTINNVVHPTFKSACVALGLLEDDEEWVQCLQEGAIMNTGHQLRRLFSVILAECSPMKPYELWMRFSGDICDDLDYKIHTLYGIPNQSVLEVKDYGLHLQN